MPAIPLSRPVPGMGAQQPMLNYGAPVAGVSEVQRITITGTPTGGTFTLSGVNPNTGNAFTTAAIAYNASAANVVTALEAKLGAGAVTGSGGALPGSAVDLTFAGTLANKNVAQMTANSAGLTGGAFPTVTPSTVTPGVTATLAGKIPKGGLLLDTQNAQTYQNGGTLTSPVYAKVGTQS